MRQERSEGLSATHLAALATLERQGPLSLGELAAHERVQPPSMTRVVAALVDAGFAERTAHPTDRRQVLASVTEAGRARLAADRRQRDEWLAERLRELPPSDLEVLRAAAPILDRLAGA
jgi:DNA-binding MarR family transcriptional regulator